MPSNNPIITCPVCQLPLKKSVLGLHLLKAHPRHKPKITPVDPHQASLVFQEDDTENTYVLWENIWFEKDKLIFKNTKCSFKPTPLKGVHKGLDLIREEYFLRMHGRIPYKLSHIKGTIDQVRSRDWGKMTSVIELAIQKLEFKTSKYSKIGRGITKQQIGDFFSVSKEKECYFKYLAELQGDVFPVIPILEINSAGKEESIIFRFLTKKGNVVVVWENMNDKRASHLFLTDIENHSAKMMDIESLILSNLPEKRAVLHGGYTNSSTVKNQVKYLRNITHSSLDEYKSKVENIVAYY